DIDLFMTHLLSETNTLYLNDGQGLFTERTLTTGLGASSLPYTGFGTAFFDLDTDGRLDLLTVNGEVRTIREQREAGEDFPLRQANQLFRNAGAPGQAVFEDWTSRAPVLERALVSRGAAFGDLDNDGDTDLVIQNGGGPVQLLENTLGSERSWLGLRLLDASGRDALGARVIAELPDAPSLERTAQSGGSYLSAGDPRVLLGLGDRETALRVTVRWPSGARETFEDLAVRRYHSLREGSGRPGEAGP
ncbi:MAG: CRTAC1 family protein, partial [Acidobacteriota bacterium]